jgi:hypothetical protein
VADRDLDRAYVINGDDLRILLGGGDGKPPLVPNPRDVAEYIVGKIACPLGSEPGDVVDAHICCEHVPGDPELAAMAALLPALPLVSKLGHDAGERVMEWARRRACDGLPPF